MRRLAPLSALALALVAGCGTAVDPTPVAEGLDLTAAIETHVPEGTVVVRIERATDTTRILGSMSHRSSESVRVLLPSSEIPELLQALRRDLLEGVESSGVELGDAQRRGSVWFLDYGTPDVEGVLELHVSAQGIDGVVIALELEERG